jgi:hypothetical protein
MAQTTKTSLQNGLIFIEDIEGGEPPYPVTDENVQFSASCISVVCLHEIDGETELMLGPAAEVAQTYEPEFDGFVETPSGELKISAVTGWPLLKTKVPSGKTRIRIWRNHPVWPDQVAIGWG